MKSQTSIYSIGIVLLGAILIFSFCSKTDTGGGSTYLALGDSYTICESAKANERWPNQLAESLRESGWNVQDLTIIAKTGWRCDQLYDATELQIKEQKFDLVSLLIGVNNEFQGWTVSQFEPEFKKCLNLAITFSKRGKEGVFVLSIPDYGYTPFGQSNQPSISSRLDDYNAVCKEVCAEEGVMFLNITDISRKGFDEPGLVAADGLHPSGKQYKEWVDKNRRSGFEVKTLVSKRDFCTTSHA
ncbi:SGNH/GDSL hydrolase family protein [Crocinitomix catalasitica]|nr:SGNH/GDSL hydrolase family protein [Crocinitomix catalasitica]